MIVLFSNEPIVIMIVIMLDRVLSFKGEPRKIKNKIVDYKLNLIAHNGLGFDSYVVLNKLSQWRSVVKLIKNGAGII